MKKSPTAITYKGKGTRQELLPNRRALAQLTKGDPARRIMGQYAKATPSVADSPDMIDVSAGYPVR